MGLITTLLRPAMVIADTALHSVLWLVVHPLDGPRTVVVGDSPHRLLVFGNFLATGWGVPSQDNALPGHIARAVSAITGRGVEVEIVGSESITSANAKSRIEELKITWFDGIVITLGVSDALRLTPPDRWRKSIDDLLRSVVEQTLPATPIVVTSIVSVKKLVLFRGLVGVVGDRHGALLNAITEELCAEYRDVTFVQLAAVDLSGEGNTAVAGYRQSSGLIASDLAPRLATTP